MNKNIPLPFKSINNKRSFIAFFNLVDFLIVCIEQTAAADEIFLIADDEDISTTELLKCISSLFENKSRLFSIHQKIPEMCFNLISKQGISRRLQGIL